MSYFNSAYTVVGNTVVARWASKPLSWGFQPQRIVTFFLYSRRDLGEIAVFRRWRGQKRKIFSVACNFTAIARYSLCYPVKPSGMECESQRKAYHAIVIECEFNEAEEAFLPWFALCTLTCTFKLFRRLLPANSRENYFETLVLLRKNATGQKYPHERTFSNSRSR